MKKSLLVCLTWMVIFVALNVVMHAGSVAAKADSEADFTINNGVLVGYYGEGGDIVVPEGVIDIAESAFRSRALVKSVIIPYGVKSIGAFAFKECSNLSYVFIPGSVTSIGDGAFSACNNLSTIEIAAENICYSFDGHALISNVDNALIAYLNLNSDKIYTIPYGVKSIGSNAFAYCVGIDTVIIPDSVTYIGVASFFDSSIKSLLIPESVKDIGEAAFCQTKLNTITIPKSITVIEDYTFFGCSELTYVDLPNSVKHIGANAFGNCSSALVVQNESAAKMSTNSDGLYYYTDAEHAIITGVVDNTTNHITIPAIIDEFPVIGIGDSAFEKGNMISITIPDSVISIGNNAFAQCASLKYVSIPDSVKDISENSFSGSNNVNLIGNAGSYVEQYAKQNNIKFTSGESEHIASKKWYYKYGGSINEWYLRLYEDGRFESFFYVPFSWNSELYKGTYTSSNSTLTLHYKTKRVVLTNDYFKAGIDESAFNGEDVFQLDSSSNSLIYMSDNKSFNLTEIGYDYKKLIIQSGLAVIEEGAETADEALVRFMSGYLNMDYTEVASVMDLPSEYSATEYAELLELSIGGKRLIDDYIIISSSKNNEFGTATVFVSINNISYISTLGLLKKTGKWYVGGDKMYNGEYMDRRYTIAIQCDKEFSVNDEKTITWKTDERFSNGYIYEVAISQNGSNVVDWISVQGQKQYSMQLNSIGDYRVHMRIRNVATGYSFSDAYADFTITDAAMFGDWREFEKNHSEIVAQTMLYLSSTTYELGKIPDTDYIGVDNAVTFFSGEGIYVDAPNLNKENYALDKECQGYACYSPNKNVVIIAFQGSSNLLQWLADFEFSNDAGIHNGFKKQIYDTFSKTIDKLYFNLPKENKIVTLKSLIEQSGQNGTQFIITGHSFGGAIAQVCHYYLVNNRKVDIDSVVSYTFASPIPFDRDLFTGSIAAKNYHCYNFINEADIVTHVGIMTDYKEIIDPDWRTVFTNLLKKLQPIIEKREGWLLQAIGYSLDEIHEDLKRLEKLLNEHVDNNGFQTATTKLLNGRNLEHTKLIELFRALKLSYSLMVDWEASASLLANVTWGALLESQGIPNEWANLPNDLEGSLTELHTLVMAGGSDGTRLGEDIPIDGNTAFNAYYGGRQPNGIMEQIADMHVSDSYVLFTALAIKQYVNHQIEN